MLTFCKITHIVFVELIRSYVRTRGIENVALSKKRPLYPARNARLWSFDMKMDEAQKKLMSSRNVLPAD